MQIYHILCLVSWIAYTESIKRDNLISVQAKRRPSAFSSKGRRPTLDGEAAFRIPYAVSVQFFNTTTHMHEHICGGTIVHEEFVISAAHCMKDNPKRLTIVGGSNKLSMQPRDKSDRRNVIKRIVHDFYRPLMGRDVVLLRVSPKFVLDGERYAKINISSVQADKGDVRGYLIGWGHSLYENSPLELVSFQSIDTKTCRQQGFIYISSTEVCAISNVGRGGCDGDSGGPLVDDKFQQLIGMLSYGRRPCQRRGIYAFTQLRPLRDWVRVHMNRELKGIVING